MNNEHPILDNHSPDTGFDFYGEKKEKKNIEGYKSVSRGGSGMNSSTMSSLCSSICYCMCIIMFLMTLFGIGK